MSGLVAILSRDPETLSRGPASLRLLAHVSGYVSAGARADGVWLGVTGWPWSAALLSGDAAGGERRDGGTGRLLVALVGEVLNRGVLARELGLADGVGQAELARAAFARWRGRLFEHLDGAYALVVHDTASGETVAGTDAAGALLLQHVRLGEDVLVASEAKAFLADLRFRPRLDRDAVGNLLLLGHDVGTRTLFEGVEDVGQGAHLEVEGGRLRRIVHWDPRVTVGGLYGDAYLDRLQGTVEQLAGEVFGDAPLLPLTGGLDSRLLAASAPDAPPPLTFTFGTGLDPDCRLGSRLAAVRRYPHRVLPLVPDYLVRYGVETVWRMEGRLSPTANITGSLMESLRGHRAFVSGIGGELGRHFLKGSLLMPDWKLLEAPSDEFERRFLANAPAITLPEQHREAVLGSAAERYVAEGRAVMADLMRRTRGHAPADRLDLYELSERIPHIVQPGLNMAAFSVDLRAPLLSRRWIEAVLSGVPSERVDDLVRLRLIRRLMPSVAMVPWTLTRLPLPVSESLLLVLRRAARLRGVVPLPDGVLRRDVLAPAGKRVKELVYWHGEKGEEWLRTYSRAFVEDVLLSDRVEEHGLLRREGLRALLEEQARGVDRLSTIGRLLMIELWCRLFEDGEWRSLVDGGASSRPAARAAER